MWYGIEIYSDEKGRSPFIEWMGKIAAEDERRIRKRILRIENDNLGDYKRGETECLNYASSLGRAIGCILHSIEKLWFCFYQEATNHHKIKTSKTLNQTGKRYNMARKYKKFRDYHMEKLRDPAEAKAYLELALEDLHQEGDRAGFLLALRDVTEAQGGISHLLEKTELKPAGVYKALSEEGNPTLSTLDRILGGLGLRLSIERAK